MSKEKFNKALFREYKEDINKEISSYYRMKVQLENVLNSFNPYYEDVKQIIGNMWLKENSIIQLTGTIYNIL
jgi:hypothetical protein